MIRIVESKQAGRLLARRAARMAEAEETVKPILEAVHARGDKALVEYARHFDGLDRSRVAVPEGDLAAAARRLSPDFRRAVRTAANKKRAVAPIYRKSTPLKTPHHQ